MKLCASNLGWKMEDNDLVFSTMEKCGYTGLEIAPTKFFPELPYNHAKPMQEIAKHIYEKYGLKICSMQSIWFGKSGFVFGEEKDRAELFDYTKRAMDFAAAIDCKNLVFGCPKPRNIPEGMSKTQSDEIIEIFFGGLADYASSVGVYLAMEANPTIYNTNFLNTTSEAIDMVRKLNRPGLSVNLDVGTMVQNEESAEVLTGNADVISHTHFSEPYIKPLEKRSLHGEVAKTLLDQNYEGYFSVEIADANPVEEVIASIEYVAGLA